MSSASATANENGSVSCPGDSCPVQSKTCCPLDKTDGSQSGVTASSGLCSHSHLLAAEAKTGADNGASDDSCSPIGTPPVVLDARRRRRSAPGLPPSDGCTRKLSSSRAGASIQLTPTPPPSPSHRGLAVNEPYVFAWTQISAAASTIKGHLLQAPDDNGTHGPGRRLSDPGCGRRWSLDSHWPTMFFRTERYDFGTPPPRAAVNCPLPGAASPPTAQGGNDRNPRLMVTPSSPITDSHATGSIAVTAAPTRRHSVALGHLSSHYLEVIAEETGLARTASGVNDVGATAAGAETAVDGAAAAAQSLRRHSLTGGVS